jgi:hypothetical protein
VTAAASASAATTPAVGRRIKVLIATIFANLPGQREDRQKTANMFTVTFGTDHVVGVLVTDKQFKFGFAVRAIVLVQWHKKLPPILREHDRIALLL